MAEHKEIDVKKLEKMLDVIIHKIEHAEEKIIIYVHKEKIGRAIGPNGSVVRAAELVIGKPIELRALE
ncbi:TPA: KH domain-containing protein [archaeon]|uniref:KH domain-containing protein n=1 Tax=Candidatus Naiadarchaeum limnaeum TaxID=2756139 RepID=A0A832V139_9ARCH|nr:KH domain-containing protein [Candidatus Naiadarchaeum limnaeum]